LSFGQPGFSIFPLFVSVCGWQFATAAWPCRPSLISIRNTADWLASRESRNLARTDEDQPGVDLRGLVDSIRPAGGANSSRAAADCMPSRRIVADGFVDACALNSIPEKCAAVVSLSGERIAIFKFDGKVSAISNVCRHQNGPLGEGKIIDGCVTCPWHGYQYLPENGASPPPFTEKVSTFQTQIRDGRVWVNPAPHPPGTRLEPSRIPAGEAAQ
jgi:nitrite reductase/ring-hydroxylating ferredoxin subunit